MVVEWDVLGHLNTLCPVDGYLGKLRRDDFAGGSVSLGDGL